MDLFKDSKARSSVNNPELTLSYLCEKDPKGVIVQQTIRPSAVDSSDHKVRNDDVGVGDDCVEMDFMNLNESGNSTQRWDRSSKRDAASAAVAEGVGADVRDGGAGREKRSKSEALNLSLALPEVSLSFAATNVRGNVRVDVGTGVRSLAPLSSTRTTTTYSNDFTAASMSYSYSHSHPFSHHPSCSLTCNSTENYEYSVGNKGMDDQIWYAAGEGTNGSVHSRFKPLGDGGGVALATGGGVGGNGNSLNLATQGSRQISRDCSSSFYQSMNSEKYSYLPSELPARPTRDVVSGDSRGKNFANSRDLDSLADGGAGKLFRVERLAREIVSESIPVMSQIVQELSEEVLESTKEYVRNLLDVPERSEELTSLQRKLDKRSDLTKETLSKCNKDQLQILVAVRTGLVSFLSGKSKIPSAELVEIFLFLRCRNVNCKMLLPVDDCECKVCSANKGFCSSCMCPVCLKFDCASNTCSWVGCDLCSHWCHASCSIQKDLIRPVPSAKSGGASEMHFYCMGCDHASEMYGFVKDVFSCCAKGWGVESLTKELDCVRKIFRRSEDFKGKELHRTADELLSRLETKIISPLDAYNAIMKLFNGVDSMSGISDCRVSSDLNPVRLSLSRDLDHRPQPSSIRKKEMKASLSKEHNPEDDDLVTLMRKDGFDSLESMIRIKEAEARMFQVKADDARREAGRIKQMIQAKIEKFEEEYAGKLSSLCLQETEERRRKKLEELKLLEDSHCDYQKMKMRMQSEIAGLLERMEATKKQWI